MTTADTIIMDNGLRLKRYLHWLFIVAIQAMSGAYAALPDEKAEDENITFNANFLKGVDPAAVDLTALLKGESDVAPGTYFSEIYVNGVFYAYENVKFETDSNNKVRPCIQVALLLQSGVFHDKIEREHQRGDCVFIDEAIDGASAHFDSGRLRLELAIPQAYMARTVRGFVPRDVWDEGANVLFFNYSGNYFNSENSRTDNRDESFYLYLRGGLNVGLWQIRNNGSYRYTPDNGSKFTNANTYIQRSLPELRAQLVMGETSTGSGLFDPFSFKGATLKSDERMLSPNQQGYAPEIRGVATGNARVTVRQNGSIIYETSVPPGPFLINDLYPTTNLGDLTVDVTGADNQIHTFTVPFASVNNSLRPGLSKYSLTLGKTDSSYRDVEDVNFVEMTYERGITNAFTLNSGIQAAANDYYSATLGGVVATSIGAFGVGTSFSKANTGDSENSGWQLDTRYNKTFTETNTALTIAGYRYSSRGFRTLNDSLSDGSVPYYENNDNFYDIRSSTYQQRQRFEVSINQGLGRNGSIFANVLWQDYYHDSSANKQYQIGYQGAYKKLSYNISASRQVTESSDGKRKNNDSIALSFRIPLGETISLTANLNRYGNEGTNLVTGISGTMGKQRNYFYNLNVGRHTKDNVNSLSANISRSNSIGNWGAGYNYSDINRTYSVTGRGGMVVHRGGITLSPYLGDTFGIIEALGADGASVTHTPGLTLNNAGYAVVPSLSPYRYNLVSLDPQGINNNAELEETQKRVAPYAGAVPIIKFKTRTGYPVLIETTLSDGSVLPVGVDVYDENDESIGLVGPGGRLYGRVAKAKGTLYVKEYGRNKGCQIRYEIDEQDFDSVLIPLSLSCQ